MISQVLIVCHANICRSPAAEMLLRDKAGKRGFNLTVRSAGIAGKKGYAVPKTMQVLLQQRDIDASAHASQPLEKNIVTWAELILVMNQTQQAVLELTYPFAVGKVFCLSHWLSEAVVPDPYNKAADVYSQVFGLIDRSLEAWCEHLYA